MEHKPSYEELSAKLAESEEIIRVLRNQEVDAVVGTKNILMLRLKETEDELRKGKEQVESQAKQLKATLDATPAIIWTALDRDCRNITGNRAAYDFSRLKEGVNLSKTGPRPDLLSNYRVFRDGVELQPTDMPIQVAARTGQKILDCALDFHFADGSIRSVLGNVIPLMDDCGCPTGAIAAFLDLTDRTQAEMALKEKTRQLEDVNKELESFSYSVSHDLRAPLRAIEGYSRMFVKKYGSALDEDAARLINVIRGNTEKMGLLIDDLLSFSRVLKNDMSISAIDMETLAGEVWKDIQAINQEREFEVRIAKLLPGLGDRPLIRQVLVNLFSNAVKFTMKRKPAVIELTSYAESDKIVYCLKDNGVGFDMTYHDKLFGVFQRLHSGEYEGTGVGLAIVQRVINRHGCRIWAESEPDKGATFYFTLPTP
ncbi:MAG: ATP-binding protein [Smithellaceae bacterium]